MKNEKSAAVDAQQTGVSRQATSTARNKPALILSGQGRDKKGQQSAAKKRRKLARQGQGMNHGMDCKGRSRSLSR
jgi:hypothetical protein